MNSTTTARNANRSVVLSYLSLFTSVSTLLCCALPSLLVLFGLGASVASLLSFMPWLAVLSRHKSWTFSICGVLIAVSFVSMYRIVPHLRPSEKCGGANEPTACRDVSRTSKVLLWVSAAIYASGFFAAYVLGSILTKLDR